MKNNRFNLWCAGWITIALWPVLAGAQTNYIPLQSFGTAKLSGANPWSELLEGSDGALYGTANTVFTLNKDGSGARTLHTFFGTIPGDGNNPMAGLVELNDGALYGTTAYGGTTTDLGFGTVFRLNKDGSGYAVLHRFGLTAGDGKYTSGTLAVSGGILFGTTWDGGSLNRGTVFKISADGSNYAIVHSFQDLATPKGNLVKGSDGALYGTTGYGSNSFAGAVFRINPNGSGYAIVRTFAETGGDPANPGGLNEGRDGMLYGTSNDGGSSAYGTLFKMAKDGTGFRVLHSFAHDGRDGIQPKPMFEGTDGALYGTTTGGGLYEGGTAFKLNKDGSGYTILRNFRNASEAGWHPAAGLIQGSDGAFYGTTYYSVGDGLGPGVVFALSLQPRSWFTAWTIGASGVTSLNARGAADTPFRLQAGSSCAALNWQDIATNLASTLGTLSFTNVATHQPQSFYRLAAP